MSSATRHFPPSAPAPKDPYCLPGRDDTPPAAGGRGGEHSGPCCPPPQGAAAASTTANAHVLGIVTDTSRLGRCSGGGAALGSSSRGS